jgi:hypothetical protein
VYPYAYAFQIRSLAVFAIVCMCCIVPMLASSAAVKTQQWRVVVVWLAVGLLAQVVLRALTAHTMEALFLGDGSNGFYQPTLRYRGLELLRDFDRLRPTLPEHPGTNMPGKLMFIYALEFVTARPAALAWLVVLVSNLGGVFLYLFVRDWFDSRETALWSFVFYLFTPAKLLLFPVLNTVTPVIVLACAWLWVRLLQTQSWTYAAVLGCAVYLVLFFEPTPAIIGLMFLVLTGHAMMRGDVGWRTMAVAGGVVVAAFAATFLLGIALFGFNLGATLQTIANHAVEFNARVRRPYGPWVGQNLLDLAFGAGYCQTVAFLACVGAAVGRWRIGDARGDGRLAAYCLGLAATILATDLAGINRGEIVRLWIFLACFAQVPAAYICARLAKATAQTAPPAVQSGATSSSFSAHAAVALCLATTLLQAALSTSMMVFAQP